MARFRAPPAALPLGWEMYEHLRGDKTPFVDEAGVPVAGDALKARLAEEGLGEHTITVSGFVRPPANAVEQALRPWRRQLRTIGTLDPDGLARLAHAALREEVITRGGAGKDTPPEQYTTAISIDSPAVRRAPPPAPPPIRAVRQYVGRRLPSGKRRAVYRSLDTGRFVSRATWERRQKKKGKP